MFFVFFLFATLKKKIDFSSSFFLPAFPGGSHGDQQGPRVSGRVAVQGAESAEKLAKFIRHAASLLPQERPAGQPS